ncbi:MAG: hypothetical protein PUF55_02850 [Bacteroidales bacterium]|nr:hypothetical protein [Bacteroidales bacterium]
MDKEVMDKLMEIKKHYDAGVLTKEEMEAEKACASADFISNNRVKVSYAKLVYEGECLANNRYEYTDKVITLK